MVLAEPWVEGLAEELQVEGSKVVGHCSVAWGSSNSSGTCAGPPPPTHGHLAKESFDVFVA